MLNTAEQPYLNKFRPTFSMTGESFIQKDTYTTLKCIQKLGNIPFYELLLETWAISHPLYYTVISSTACQIILVRHLIKSNRSVVWIHYKILSCS